MKLCLVGADLIDFVNLLFAYKYGIVHFINMDIIKLLTINITETAWKK